VSDDADTPLDLHQAASLLGAYCAIERRLFEVTGAAANDPEAGSETAVLLSSLSAEHAWHAELWADRLPVLSSLEVAGLVVLPPDVDAVFDDLSSAGPLEQLSGLFRVVLPRLVSSYARHEASASPAAEAPTRRALRLVLADETEEWARGESLVEGILTTPQAVEAAGEAVIRLESRLVGAGVGVGLVAWPGRRA
jgi:hypothetical protein